MKRAGGDEIILSFKVLISKEDEEFVAHALEADLMGYGTTIDDACTELVQALEAQISFALQKENFSLIDHPAPPEFFDRWENIHAELLKKRFAGKIEIERKSGRPAKAEDVVESRLAKILGYSSDDLKKFESRAPFISA